MDKSELQKFVESLPVKTVRIGSEARMVGYDEEAGEIYLLDVNGKWNGQKAKLPQKTADKADTKKTSTPAAEPEENGAEAAEETGETAAGKQRWKRVRKEKEKSVFPSFITRDSRGQTVSGNKTETTELQRKKTKGLAIIGICFLALVALFIASFFFTSGTSDGNSDSGNKTQASDIQDVSSGIPETFSVLVASHNLTDGHVLQTDDLAVVSISRREFALSGGVYTADCADALVGMRIVGFVPCGSLLTYDICSSYYGIPRYTDSSFVGKTYIDIPYTVVKDKLNSFVIGDTVSIVLEKDTTTKTSGQADTGNDGEMEHSSSVSASITTDTYKFSSIIIADFLDEDKNPLYPVYYGLLKTPDAYLHRVLSEEYNENPQALVPHYVRVYVSSGQAKAIGDLPNDGTVRLSMKLVSAAEVYEFPYYREAMTKINDDIVMLIEANETED